MIMIRNFIFTFCYSKSSFNRSSITW